MKKRETFLQFTKSTIMQFWTMFMIVLTLLLTSLSLTIVYKAVEAQLRSSTITIDPKDFRPI